MPLTYAEPIRVLLVEDNPVDTKIALRMIRSSGVMADVRHASDGIEALGFLRGSGDAAPFRPDVILLDLSLPRLRGIDVMAALAEDDVLAVIPVVVLTGSEDRDDVLLEARRVVRNYLRKPLDKARLTAALHDVENRARLNRLRALAEPYDRGGSTTAAVPDPRDGP